MSSIPFFWCRFGCRLDYSRFGVYKEGSGDDAPLKLKRIKIFTLRSSFEASIFCVGMRTAALLNAV